MGNQGRGLAAKLIWPAIILLIAASLLYGCGSAVALIAGLTASTSSIVVGKTVTFTCSVAKSSEATYTYSWSATGGSFPTNFGASVSWTAPDTSGSYVITVKVTKSDGAVDSASINVSVLNGSEESSGENPIIDGITASIYRNISPGGTVNLSCEAHNPTTGSGESGASLLQYTWTTNGGSITGSGKSAAWTAPSTSGTYLVTVKVINIASGYYSTGSQALIVSGESSSSDIIQIDSLGYTPTTLFSGDSASLYCSAEIISGTTTIRTYTWTVDGGTLTGGGLGASTPWKSPSSLGVETTYHAIVEVTDSNSNKAQGSFAIIVSPSIEAPVISNITVGTNPVTHGGNTSVITCLATDPNSPARTLTYTWTLSSGASGSLSPTSSTDNTTTYTSGASTGTYTIFVKVTNGGNSYATGQTSITVN